MLRYSVWVLAGFCVLQTCAAQTLLPGFYLGPGRGITDILHVLPGGKTATLSGIPTAPGVPVSGKVIREAATPRYGAYTGTLQKIGSEYVLTLDRLPTKVPASTAACQYRIIPTTGGWRLRDKTASDCSRYRGFSWGFGQAGASRDGNYLQIYSLSTEKKPIAP